MHKEQFVILTEDHHKLAVTIFEPENPPIGHIHILHGMAEHHERYSLFAEVLVNAGYFVSMHDHRGHGQTAKLNQATMGFLSEKNGFDKVVEDVKTVTEIVRQNKELPPMILFGHSMGSFIARRYCELYSKDLEKVIFCGTGAIGIEHYIGVNLAKFLAKTRGKTTKSTVMNELTFGNFNRKIKNAKTKFDWLSTDPTEVKKYLDDQACGFISTNQFFVDFLQGIITLSKQSELCRIRKDLPILLISGSNDPVGSYTKGIWLVAKQLQNCGLKNITVQLFEGMRHEILNEMNREFVFQRILQWLEKKE